MAFDGSVWDPTSPTNSDLVNEIDDNLRDVKQGVAGRLAHEHVFPTSQSATNQGGYHTFITFQGQTSTPGLVYGTNTQSGCLFVNSTSNSLIFENSAGTNITLVPGATDSGGLVPTGMISMYGGTSEPNGWFICNGQAVSRSTYARLFSVLGSLWGSGDGSSTFNVPDLRGRGPYGVHSGTSAFAAIATSGGNLTVDISHTHSVAHTGWGTTVSNVGDGVLRTSTAAASENHATAGISSVSSGTSALNMLSPYVAVNFIIKN